MSRMIKEIGLSGYRTIKTKDRPEVSVTLEPRQRRLQSCPCCGGVRGLRSKGRYERRVRHLDCFGRRTSLRILCRRFSCLDCARSFVQRLPGIVPGRRTSEPLRVLLYRHQHDGMSAAALARRERLGAATLARIYNQQTERCARERQQQECPMVLGIDEHSLHRRERFATTFCDLKNHRIFEVAPGRSEAQLRPFLRSLRGRDKVRVVCIDLSSPYRAIVRRWFPNAKIVADRFHVVRLVLLHLFHLARERCPDLNWNRPWLKLLRTRADRLEPCQRERLEALFVRSPFLAHVHALKEELCSLLTRRAQTKRQCRALIPQLLSLIHRLKTSGLDQAATLGRSLHQWREEIVRMWRFSRNNGITEGFHRKMKLIQRKAYGFRSFLNYRLRVLAQCS